MERKSIIERFRRPISAVVGVGLGMAALTACASAEVKDNYPGTVVEHVYHPSYTSLVMAGKVLIPIHHSEEFDLEIRQCDRTGDEYADAEGCVTAEREVTHETYDAYPNGAVITFTR